MEIIIGICFLFLIGLLPVFIANHRDHKDTLIIFLLVLFLGWTVIGWFVALLWAFTSPNKKEIKTPTNNLTEELKELSFLLKNNVITQEEYEKRKQIILEKK